MRDPGGVPADDAELQPQAGRSGGDGLAGVRWAELGPAKDVNQLERAGRVDRFGEGRERGDPGHLELVGVDGDAVEPPINEIAEDIERRPGRIGRSADDRDPPRRPQDLLDPGIVEDRDPTASLLQVEERGRALALLRRQWRASLSYGMPSAAGGIARPTTPARTMIVKT